MRGSLPIPDPAGELLSGDDENATFSIFFTPFLRFLRYRVCSLVGLEILDRQPVAERILVEKTGGTSGRGFEGLKSSEKLPISRDFWT